MASQDYFERRNELYGLGLLHIATKALHLATQLNFDKLLDDNPQSIDKLAKELNFHPKPFFKFLRLLDAYDIVELVGQDQIKAGRLTAQLSDLRSPHVFHSYQFIDELEHVLQTNSESHSKVFGKPFYPYIVEHKEKIEQFREWCTNTAKDWLPATLSLYDLSDYEKIIDIGGGEGYFVAEVLAQNPQQKGILLDQPSVVENADKVFAEYAVADRAAAVGGDFFAEIPNDCDAYFVCRTLLNWSDEDAIKLLNNVYDNMPDHADLFMIDFMLPAKDYPGYREALMSDINLLALMDSALRTEPEWLELVKQSKFTLDSYKITGPTPELIYPMIMIKLTES